MLRITSEAIHHHETIDFSALLKFSCCENFSRDPPDPALWTSSKNKSHVALYFSSTSLSIMQSGDIAVTSTSLEAEDEELELLVELGQQRAEQRNGGIAKWYITASSAIAIGIIGIFAFI
jgi:hypothetical protein